MKKKKSAKKKKNLGSDIDEEMQNVLLKQLDFKKQLIIKKIEEIDSISERSGRKKELENRQKKKEKYTLEESSLLENFIKADKKQKPEAKSDRDNKKSRSFSKKSKAYGKSNKDLNRRSQSSSESDSECSESNKKKKIKKSSKKKKDSSESSDSEEITVKNNKVQNKFAKNIRAMSKTDKKYKKLKLEKKKDSSSSESESDDDFEEEIVKVKRKDNFMKSNEGNLDKDETNGEKWKEDSAPNEGLKSERNLGWETKKSPKSTSEGGKEGKDWESSTSFEESGQENKNSSWDNEAPSSIVEPEISKVLTIKDDIVKFDEKSNISLPKKEQNDSAPISKLEPVSHPPTVTLKTSLSNFSFNENSFCSFGQELSRDFFLTEQSFSNSAPVGDSEYLSNTTLEPRPFQFVNKNSEVKKPTNSELYSPGYTDSESSDTEIYNNKIGVTNSNSNSNLCCETKEEVYDPLNCESEGSAGNNEVELSSIPLPCVSDILLPGEERTFGNQSSASSLVQEKNLVKSPLLDNEKVVKSNVSSPLTDAVPAALPKSNFTSSDFMPILVSNSSPFSCMNEEQTRSKKPVINMKSQQKLKSKAASVFQDESDEEVFESQDKSKLPKSTQAKTIVDTSKSKIFENVVIKNKEIETKENIIEKILDERKMKKDEDVSRERSRGRSKERESRRKRSISRDRKDSYKSVNSKTSSPNSRRTPESKYLHLTKEKREIKNDSFEIEPLKSSTTLEETVQPIPVLTGLGMTSCDRVSWNRSHIQGFSCNEFSEPSEMVVDHPESFDIYPSKYQSDNFDSHGQEESAEKSVMDNLSYVDDKNKKDERKSHSRSPSPRKKRRSKSPERRKSPRSRSPRRRSLSPKRREKSPYSPRKRSPKRKGSPRRYRGSRSPDRRRKSRSRSPRKRRRSLLRRSRSLSPRRHRSPKRRATSPKRRDSPSRTFSPVKSMSPRKDIHFHHNSSALQNRIPVIGSANKDVDMEMSPSTINSPRFDSPMGFSLRSTDPTVTNSEINNSFYNLEHNNEFEVTNYPEEVGINNLITVKSHDIEKVSSPERLSLDQRIELELGVQLTSSSQTPNEQYQISNQACQQFQEMNSNHFPNSYNCDNNANGDSFYQNQNISMNPDFSNQYFNTPLQQSANYGPFQQYPNSQSVQNSVMQVGNIVEVVPTLQQPPPPPPPLPPGKPHQIMQVGNVLQVVPSQKIPLGPPVTTTSTHNYGPSTDTSPLAPVKTQKATAVVAPSSVIPTPNPEVMNPLIKAIQLEREKRRKEKEKRKAEKEARRKARQLRREAKLMSVNEKLKKSVVDEGLMLGQEVEDEELLDGLDVPSPPIPVEIITVSSPSALPPAGKGILITAGFMPKPPSEKKEVKFADGVLPGEGTSTSGGEDIASPPPKPKLPKEKRYKKKKTKVKKKVKVQIIRQIIHDEVEEEEDDLSPPPPPPGDPPPVFFARFPFAGDAQFPVYQTQTTTTTTLTTVQYPSQPF